MDRRFRWTAALAAILFSVAIGVVSYNVGVSHGVAIGAAAIAAAPAAGSAPFGPYGWYRPWGFGFFGPFAFVLFWFLTFRLLFWGGLHRRRWHYGGPHDIPRSFEEWHRRAHEQMNSHAPSPPQSA